MAVDRAAWIREIAHAPEALRPLARDRARELLDAILEGEVSGV